MKAGGLRQSRLLVLLLLASVALGAEEKPDKDGPEMREYAATAEITLGDDRVVSGKSKFTAPESFIFQHNRDGVQYEKTIRARDVRALHFQKWEPVKVGENKQGDVYRFEVTSFRIELKDGYKLQVNNGLPSFWQSFYLENDNGRVRFFTYWMDLYKKEDGSWYTGMEGPATGVRSFPHKDVIRKIEFKVD
ncbi:MAG: hypothetical protein CMN77_09275 [Spirochaetaceae bacterium]|nr:hypothetical protein [Spirochaetaceae bacterium]|tara:strand:- start:100268 stop:100840 length:573 start_codon:yes stop_codon:yes gene_type:complete